MKIVVTLIILFYLTTSCFSQNIAPTAVSDTIYLEHDDSVFFNQLSGASIWGVPIVLTANDFDSDSDIFYIDTAFYNGLGVVSISPKQVLITNIFNIQIHYKPMAGFWGLDSIQYVIKDTGTPAMSDTANIYIFVKRTPFELLNLNNISATIAFDGLFTDKRITNTNNFSSGFEVPKGNNTHTIAGAYLWIGGKNQDSVFTNARDNHSFSAPWGNSGPLMDSIYYNYNYSYKWDRVWKITNNEIQYHINNWNQPNYQPPQVFLDWPAQGDTSKGQAFYLAPFVDNNNDGIYNPYDGDYPKIKGQQAVYFIYNNERDVNLEFMRTEIHGMAYAYNCSSDSAINNTIFLDYTIYNRSNLTFDSTYIGFVANLSIGPSTWSSYIGSDVDRSSYYAYNADSINQPDTTSIYDSYGNYPPAQSVTFLKGAKQGNDGIDNAFGIALDETVNGLGFGDGIVDNEYWGMEHFMSYSNGGCGFSSCPYPVYPIDYYNFLKGIWMDGAPLVYGLNGHPASGGTVPTKFQYPNNSDSLWYGTGGLPQAPWSEMNAGPNGSPNYPVDKNGVGSTGPFTFYPDSSITITLAFVFGRDYQTTGAQAGVVVMQERVDSIRSYFTTNFVSVCGGALSVSEHKIEENNLIIYPNPFNNEITINYKLKSKVATLEVYSLMGKKIITKTITKNTTKINLSNLARGIYFLKVSDGNTFITRKVIKQ